MIDASLIAEKLQPCCEVPLSQDDDRFFCQKCGRVVELHDVELPAKPPEPALGGQAEVPGSAVAPRPQESAQDPITAHLRPMEATEIYTPDLISKHIAETVRRLEQGAVFQRQTIIEREKANVAYEKAYARAVVASDGGAADVRKAEATIACEEELQRKMEADMMDRAVKATMHDLRAALSGYQSIGNAVRSTYQAAGQAAAAHERSF